LAAKGDLSINAINFFNVFNFAASIFLLVASCSILYVLRETEKEKEQMTGGIIKAEKRKVELTTKLAAMDAEEAGLINELEKAGAKKTDLTMKLAATINEAEKEELTAKLTELETEEKKLSSELTNVIVTKSKSIADFERVEKEKIDLTIQLANLENKTLNQYEYLRERTQIILYIGAIMLFVGMLRVKLLTDWHLIFISKDLTNSSYLLLSEYFNSTLAIQAGFYTIVLAAIYLPVAYVIATKTKTDAAATVDTSKSWWWGSFTTILPRLLTIISPFLARPVVDLFNILTGQTQ
jgi:energy-converting hydrogenase Eha subunit E